MIEIETRDTTTILRLEHGKANALDLELLQALDEQLAEFGKSEQRAMVITGRGRIFSAGVDLFRLLEDGEAYLEGFLTALQSAMRNLYAIEKPIVAAVNGHAIAGGCVIAAACDHRVMADGKGKIGVSELYVGVPFPPIALEIMRASLAPHVVDDLVLTGRLVGPVEAQHFGLVHGVVPPDELLDAALQGAAHLGSVLPDTFALTKRALRQPVLRAVDEDFAAIGEEVAAQWRKPEVHATIREFLDATIGKG